MFRHACRSRPTLSTARHCTRQIFRRCFSDRRNIYEPLRILFCGADEFSIYSLRALHSLREQRPDSIASIEVVCRPDKRVGRGLKRMQEVPIKTVANQLHLPLHQIDSFRGWSPPSPVDLVIAVSFGLLIPARVLKETAYGGLNVHPSLLPDLRGPAPIQHTLLRATSHTGVTLQTLHPSRFDHGTILDQTPPPGIPVPQDGTPDQLVHQLGPIAADMLVKGISDGIFVSASPCGEFNTSAEVHHAPKITPEDRKIDWKRWTAEHIIRRDRVLGRLWDTTTYGACHAAEPKRVTFGGPWRVVPREDLQDKDRGSSEGAPTLLQVDGAHKPRLAFHTADDKIITPTDVTIEGEQKGKAMPGLVRAVEANYKALAAEKQSNR